MRSRNYSDLDRKQVIINAITTTQRTKADAYIFQTKLHQILREIASNKT